MQRPHLLRSSGMASTARTRQPSMPGHASAATWPSLKVPVGGAHFCRSARPDRAQCRGDRTSRRWRPFRARRAVLARDLPARAVVTGSCIGRGFVGVRGSTDRAPREASHGWPSEDPTRSTGPGPRRPRQGTSVTRHDADPAV